MNQFEPNKTYKTRDGREAIIYAVLDDVIHGAVGNTVRCWNYDGKWILGGKEHANDLMSESGWEMKPAAWLVECDGDISLSKLGGVSDAQKFGIRYHTKEIAQREAKRMKEANMIAYWASVLEPEWEADWEADEQPKYYIYYDVLGVFCTDFVVSNKTLGIPYSSEETMQKICDALNSDDIKL